MNVQPLSVGPILGATTADAARVWGRAEIEDAWPAYASTRDWVVKYPSAIHAYLTYQASHSPLMTMSAPNRMVGVPAKLWYTFNFTRVTTDLEQLSLSVFDRKGVLLYSVEYAY